MKRFKKLNRRTALFILVIIAVSFSPAHTFCEHEKKDNHIKLAKVVETARLSTDDDFIPIESDTFVILYEPEVKLSTIYRRLHQRRFYVGGRAKRERLASFEEKIAYRVNILLARVKEILDMYPPEIYFKVKIYKDRKEVHAEYYKISRKKRKVKSFYNHRFKTIYISEDDISDSVLAHEIAHVVIDNYFIIRPPEKVSEMMAMFADSELN